MTSLYNVGSPLNRNERNNLNATFEDILRRFANLQRQINTLAGDEEVDMLLQRIEDAISLANNTTANTQQVLDDISQALSVLSNMIADAEQLDEDVQQTLDDLTTALANFDTKGVYEESTTYYKNGIVRYGRDSYIALKTVTGITPTDDGVNWRLFAQGGIDGTGSVNRVNNVSPDETGNIILTPSDIDAVSQTDFTQRLAQVEDEKAPISETQRLENVKAAKTEVDTLRIELQNAINNKAPQSTIDALNTRIDNLLLESGDANLEVTDAHVSEVKDITFVNIKERFEALEAETHLSMTNMIENGDFEGGKNRWTSAGGAGTGGSSTVTQNRAYKGVNSLNVTNVAGSRREEQTIATVVGHKYYTRGVAWVTSFSGGSIVISSVNGNVIFDGTKLNQWQTKSLITTANSDTTIIRLGANGESTFNVDFDTITIIDLTATFGVGKEPSIGLMDMLMAQYPMQHFNGTVSRTKQSLASLKAKTDEIDTKIIDIKNLTGYTAKNLITNGSFKNGNVNWNIITSTFSATNNVATFTATAQEGRIQQAYNVPVGNVVYIAADVKANSSLVGIGRIMSINSFHSGSGQFERLSHSETVGGTMYLSVIDKRASAWAAIDVKNVIALDLTVIFGRGNEPTKDEMDAILANLDNAWFDNVDTLLLDRYVLNFYRAKIKEYDTKINSIALPVIGYIDNPKRAAWTGQAMVTLSYDDGLLNNLYKALPLHEKHGIPATFNIITNRFDVNEFFDQRMVRECFERDVEIASHSHYHNARFTDLSDEQLHFECSESKRLLEEIVGVGNVETMAIPFSFYDERVKAITSQYYKGVRVYSELWDTIPPADRYWLKSAIAVTNTTTFNQVKNKIDYAVANNLLCTIMLHGISNNDVKTDYEISQQLLEQILIYIRQIGRDKLLPVTTRDALKFSFGSSY